MSFEGYTRTPVESVGSLVTNFASEKLPAGVSPAARNVRYTLNSVATRFGTIKAIDLGEASRVNGLGVLVRTGQNPTYFPLGFTESGKLRVESPVGQGTCVDVAPTYGALPQNSFMAMVATFQRAYLAFGDLQTGTGTPQVYNGTNLDPCSMRPIGEKWKAGETYEVGEIICPNIGNTHIYRCTQRGVSGVAEPVWTLGAGDVQPVDGGCLWQEANMIFTLTGVGNICAGLRYVMVMFVNRNGYISGCLPAAVASFNAGSAGFSLRVQNLPTGPANTAQRILAFTVVGLSSDGPFFYVPADDLSGGINIKSTVINDNVTTDVTLNFTDYYLGKSTAEVTDNQRKIKLPPQAHVVFLKPLHRLLWFGEAGQPTLVRVSEADDPETYYGDTGYMYISRDDGERAITACEWRQEIYVFKERAFYNIRPSDGDPVTWAVVPRWTKFGTCGPRAVDAGSEFIAFANRAGLYAYNGTEPIWLTLEIDDIWKTINWDYGHRIVVHVDDERKELRCAVPTGDSAYPNLLITMNYSRGIDAPIHYSAFAKKEIASPDARKWSIDDIQASMVVRVERSIPSDDKEQKQSQILFGSPFEDGLVYAVTPGVYTDNGQPIDSYYETASLGKDAVNRFGGFDASMSGNGQILAEAVPYHGARRPFTRRLELLPNMETYIRRQCRHIGRQWGVRFSTAKQVGAWFEIFRLGLYLQPFSTSEIATEGKPQKGEPV